METDPDAFGTKGKNLHVLCVHGIPVPLTFCLVSDAYRFFAIVDGKDVKIEKLVSTKNMTYGEKASAITDLIVNAAMPEDIGQELERNDSIAKTDDLWAVRSSSNKEDLAELSFAGLYESYLNAQGTGAVTEAVKKCWASLWSERAIAYREKNGLNHDQTTMSVLIQKMVDARYSGVLFTRNPHHPAKSEMIVEYTRGLSEQLMAGRVEPPYACRIENMLTVSYTSAERENRLVDAALRELARMALNIESIFGLPCDIEWAYEGEKFYVLQARPITQAASPRRVALDKLWTRANIGEVLPSVVTPLTWSIFGAVIFGKTISSDKYLGESAGVRLIDGRAYLRVDHFLNSFCYLPFVTPETLQRVLGLQVTDHAGSYRRPKGFRVRLAQGLFLLTLTGLIPYLATRAKRLPPLNRTTAGRLDELLQWNARCFKVHMLCTAYAIATFALIDVCLTRWLSGERARNTLPLILIGREDLQTAAQGRSLAELALYVQNHPAMREPFEKATDWTEVRQRLATVEGGSYFLSMMEDFLEANGARTAEEFELASPRWRENPAFLLSVIGKFIEAQPWDASRAGYESRQREQREEVMRTVRHLSAFKGFIFRRLLCSYKDFSTLRENMKYRLMEGYAEIREIFIQAGKTLTRKGLLAAKEDVFFLTPGEIDACLRDKSDLDGVGKIIADRKRHYDRLRMVQAEDFVLDSGKNPEEHSGSSMDARTLSGVGCSPGLAEGRAKVLHDISESNMLKVGEVLVTPHTDPGWTPLFLTCKAIVTEIGGFLSHGATVAREYGIPAVVNVSGATRKIHTGDLVRVDGAKGTITIIESAVHAGSGGI